jgi:hypothetical protein
MYMFFYRLPSARLAVSASLARDMKQRLDATHTARAFPPVGSVAGYIDLL